MALVYKIIEIINYAGIVQGLFLAFVLFTGRAKNKKAGYILGALLALFSMNIIHSIFLAGQFISPLKFREPFITLLCPFLYFYVLEINQDLRINFLIVKHFALFISFFLFQAALKIDSFRLIAESHDKIFSPAMIVLMLLQFIFYIFQITKTVKIYDTKIENEFSHTDELNISWTKSFLAIFIIIYFILFIALFFLVHLDYFTDYNRIIATIFAVSIYILGYKGIRQQAIAIDIKTDEVINNDNPIITFSAEKISIKETSADVSKELIEKIKNYMIERKPFLDPDITLSDLARELDIGRNALSFAINSGFKMNFFNFINRYRVEEVIIFLNDPQRDSHNFLNIAYDAGFNSKATFNHIFKKNTGFTPKEYKLRLKRIKSDV